MENDRVGEAEKVYEEIQQLAAEVLPPCVRAMRCYCAAHAKGRAASGPCDANENVEP